MKIDVVCQDGSPLGVTSKTLWGDAHRIGLGGSEYALITMCEEWTKAGHTVTLYNDPLEVDASPFEQRPCSAFNSQEKRDVVIVFRSPNPKVIDAKGLKIWWSCDQYTTGNFSVFSSMVNKIVCISETHSNYFKMNYGIDNPVVIDLPVRLNDFEGKSYEKVMNRIIFTSVPLRGLNNLRRIWPKIKQAIPTASLVITSDYRLWGASHSLNDNFRLDWMLQEDVSFLGAIKRSKLIEEELKAEIFLYPSNYEELFCISCAEAQVAGAYPITSDTGALKTTNMGTIIYGNADNPVLDSQFISCTINELEERDKLLNKQSDLTKKARMRFDPKAILKIWDEQVFNVL